MITSISPTSGTLNTQVEILGSNFGKLILENQVSVNGKVATIVSASESKLVIKVPARAGTGIVKVETSHGIAHGPGFNFTYTISVETLSGNGTPGLWDGRWDVAQYDYPAALAFDRGRIFVADYNNHRIRLLWPPDGGVSTFSGTTAGFQDSQWTTAKYNRPRGICVDKHNDAYFVDEGNARIRKLDGSYVTTIAGSGSHGFKDGPSLDAEFSSPDGIAVDKNLVLYVADTENHRIRKIDQANAKVSTFAGTGTPGIQNGVGSSAQFFSPAGIAIAPDMNLFVADAGNHCIRMITTSGEVSTAAGNSVQGFSDGPPGTAKFNSPMAVTFDKDQIMYVADTGNNAIRMLIPGGNVVTIAGNPTPGTADGPGNEARFNQPCALVIDDVALYVAEKGSYRIRKVLVQ